MSRTKNKALLEQLGRIREKSAPETQDSMPSPFPESLSKEEAPAQAALQESAPATQAALAVETAPASRVLEVSDRADPIIRTHVALAGGASLLPLPLLDMTLVAAIQLRMIKELTKVYELPFSEHRGKSLISALVTGYGVPCLAWGGMFSLLKTIPFVGLLAGGLALPVLTTASTYATGTIFANHFASGGTLWDFDPSKHRQLFAEKFNKQVEESRSQGRVT